MTTSTLIIQCSSVLSCLLVPVNLPALREGAVSLEDNCKPGLKNQKSNPNEGFSFSLELHVSAARIMMKFNLLLFHLFAAQIV